MQPPVQRKGGCQGRTPILFSVLNMYPKIEAYFCGNVKFRFVFLTSFHIFTVSSPLVKIIVQIGHCEANMDVWPI